jgi:hypothetical protein
MIKRGSWLVAGLLLVGACTSSPAATTSVPPTTSPPSTALPTSTTEAAAALTVPAVDLVVSYGGIGFDYATAVQSVGEGAVAAIDLRSPGADGGDLVLARYDDAGALAWASQWGGPRQDSPQRNTLAVGDDGSAIVAASLLDTDGPEWDLGVVKVNADGQLVWQIAALGAPGAQRPHGVALSGDDIVVAGHHGPPADGNGEGHSHEILVLRFASTGDLMWQRSYAATGQFDTPYSMTVDGDGNILLGGHAGVGNDDADVMAAKLDPDGNVLWAFTWGAVGPIERAWDVATDDEGAVYLAGPVYGVGNGGDSIFALRISAGGELQWARIWRIPGNELWGTGIEVSPTGDLLLSGFIGRVADAGIPSSGYLVSVSPTGDLEWQVAIGSVQKEGIEALAFTDSGRLLAAGQGGREDQTVVELAGLFEASDIELVELPLEPTSVTLTFADPEYPFGPAAGDEGGGTGADAQLMWLTLP